MMYIISGKLKAQIEQIIALLLVLTQIVKDGFKTMTEKAANLALSVSDVDAQLAAMDNELQTLSGAVGSVSTELDTVITDVEALAAKVSPDLSAEVTHIKNQIASVQAINTAVAQALQKAQNADADATGAQPTPAPSNEPPAGQ